MTTVVNRRHTQAYDVYIGRPSKWGNPFRIGQFHPDIRGPMTREDVLLMFMRYWNSDSAAMLRVEALRELAGKVLGCWCPPESCHGDIIAAYVNEYGDQSR